jgi:hypothetical protein
VWGEMEQYYEDEISKKRYNQNFGDPAEKSNLSASVDWKIMKNKRKLKIRDMKDAVKRDQDSIKSDRAKLLRDHGNNSNP